MLKTIIVAKAKNNAIGKDNDLPWHLPEDLKFFKSKTSGQMLIMGRKTFEALGGPLPKREHILITRNKDYKAQGAEVVHSLEEALEMAEKSGREEVYIIGGAQIYTQALEAGLTDRMFITEVNAEPEADAYFPDFDASQWDLFWKEEHPVDNRHKYPFTFTEWRKKK